MGAEQFPEMFEKAALERAGQPHEVAEVGGVPGVGSRLVRDGRDHSGRRWLSAAASATARLAMTDRSTQVTGE